MQEYNATIKSTYIRFDRGCLTLWLDLEYGNGTMQGFGGFHFDRSIRDALVDDRREGTAYGTEFIRMVMLTVGVENWDDLKGKNVRVRRRDGYDGFITAIGHITKDRWFNPKIDLEHLREK